MDETKIYDSTIFKSAKLDDSLRNVINILSDRGYDSVNQLVGYLMSGDPGYISNYKNARKIILSYSRSEIIEFLLEEYINK